MVTSPLVARFLVLAAVALALSGCTSSTYTWGWHVISPFDARGRNNLLFLTSGIWATLSISIISIVISVLVGIAVALAALSRQKALRGFNQVYVETFRSVPLLVLLLWVYYGLPVVAGIQFGVFAAGVISLALSDSAFEAEFSQFRKASGKPGAALG
jgi:His/Glu/Gln/Arg/opine family amino acid ABC transporter permease subunit